MNLFKVVIAPFDRAIQRKILDYPVKPDNDEWEFTAHNCESLRERTTTSGFMLLELIIVLFLMSIILGLSAVYFANSLPGYRLNATVRSISTTVKEARAFAKILNEQQVVTIDLENRQYALEGHTPKDIPSDIAVKVVDPVEGEIIEGQYLITVHTTGGVEGGTIVLSNDRKTVSIQIDPIIGTVRIE